jgi:hypothetical protein
MYFLLLNGGAVNLLVIDAGSAFHENRMDSRMSDDVVVV